MEQNIIECLQGLQLTKEEEEDISISSASRSELLEEWSLSLFGRLLSDRQQNMRALKSTLRLVWKMGSDLQIIEVGNTPFSSSLDQGFKWNGLRTASHGTSTTISSFYADGKKV